jgi:hypothetical protein
MEISSYGDVYQIGHKAVVDIFADPVTIEEKIDGSLFAFNLVDGELYMRSKGTAIYKTDDGECSAAMFNRAVKAVDKIRGELNPAYTYYGEYLQKPKHNIYAYDRVPQNHIIIFDIKSGEESFLSHAEKIVEAARLGFECVPLLYSGTVRGLEQLKAFLQKDSILGGQKIEGFVVKNYSRFTPDKKVMKGKYVSEQFKETHEKNWKSDGNKQEIQALLINSLRTDARWLKAIQHLREKDKLTNSPKDIGNLMKEVQIDIEKEESEYIKDQLYKHFRKNILRGVTRGLPEWYKEQLAQKSFGPEMLPEIECPASLKMEPR